MSSSTSSSNSWKAYAWIILGGAVSLAGIFYLFIIIVDPFDNLPLSPDWRRQQVSGTDRYFKPSVARRSHYDSVVVGTSSIMLIHPQRMNASLDANFATLAMPAASPYEQLLLLDLFLEHHSKINHILVGMDRVWCQPEGSAKQLGANVGNRIPDELYDDNNWNNWPALSSKMIKYSRRQVQALNEKDEGSAGYDGYFNFTSEYPAYNLQEVKARLYRGLLPTPIPIAKEVFHIDEIVQDSWKFPDLSELKKRLRKLPESTQKVLVFVPYHWYEQPHSDTIEYVHFSECKKRVAEWSDSLKNYTVIDFMRHSSLTYTDSNYWDPIHYTNDIAQYIEKVISGTLKGIREEKDEYIYLTLP